MKMIAVTCALTCASAFGTVMPQLPEPSHADTEVWTNVPCAQMHSDVREFEPCGDRPLRSHVYILFSIGYYAELVISKNRCHTVAL